MTLLQGARWACALVLLLGAGAARAGWDGGVFQVCCNHCGSQPAVSGYAPVVTSSYYVQRCYYAPEPPCHTGPVRRLLRRIFHPSCPPPAAVAVVPPPCAAPPPPMPIVPYPTRPAASPAPGPMYPPNEPPAGPTPVPPISGSSYPRPAPAPAPIPGQPLTPPAPPTPVRLDRIVSNPDGQTDAVPAVRTRAVDR